MGHRKFHDIPFSRDFNWLNPSPNKDHCNQQVKHSVSDDELSLNREDSSRPPGPLINNQWLSCSFIDVIILIIFTILMGGVWSPSIVLVTPDRPSNLYYFVIFTFLFISSPSPRSSGARAATRHWQQRPTPWSPSAGSRCGLAGRCEATSPRFTPCTLPAIRGFVLVFNFAFIFRSPPTTLGRQPSDADRTYSLI